MVKLSSIIFNFILLIYIFALKNNEMLAQNYNKKIGIPNGCISSGISIFPFSDTIYPNSKIIIQGVGADCSFIEGLKGQNKVFLYDKYSNKTIYLKLVKFVDGNSNLFQALFMPKSPLEVNKNYVLKFKNDSPEYLLTENFHPVYGFSMPTKNYVLEKTWHVFDDSTFRESKTSFALDTVSELNKFFGLVQGRKDQIRFPMSYVKFSFHLDLLEPYFFQINITDLKTKSHSSLFTFPKNNEFLIGRGNTCYGNFNLLPDSKYAFSIIVYDIYGRSCNYKTKVTFEGPSQ